MSIKQLTLITGAANSGKSEFAENLAENQPLQVIYIATAQKNEQDLEWTAKIIKHRQRRPKNWLNWEIPLNLTDAIINAPPESCLLIDSLGTWVTNYLTSEEDIWQKEVKKLLNQLTQSQHTIIIVAEETGWGVVPAYELGRLFRNRLGNLIRQVGLIADNVYLIVAGYAVDVTKIGINTSKNL